MLKGSGATRPRGEENYEHVLMCLICRSLFDDYDHQPKFLPCHHTFCKDCLREYVLQMGDDIECPSCRKVANVPAAGVAALQTNFYVKYIQSLVSGTGGTSSYVRGECSVHPSDKLQYYCEQCHRAICKQCCTSEEAPSCRQHPKVAITTITEESHLNLDSAFSRTNGTIEAKKVQLEGLLKGLCEEKDLALRKIDSTFEQHVHTLNRRATLLKNKVIDIYKENVEKLEQDLEEISTAMTCIVSLKDYHEDKISHANFREIEKGIEDIDEVNQNITERIKPTENHIVFEEQHGSDKFKVCAKDLGRVRCTRPMVPRAEPEGNDAAGGTLGSRNALQPQGSVDDESKPTTPANDSNGAMKSSGSNGNCCTPANNHQTDSHDKNRASSSGCLKNSDNTFLQQSTADAVCVNGNANETECDKLCNNRKANTSINEPAPSCSGFNNVANPVSRLKPHPASSSAAPDGASGNLAPSKGYKSQHGKSTSPRSHHAGRDHKMKHMTSQKQSKPVGKPIPPTHLPLTSVHMDPNANTSSNEPGVPGPLMALSNNLRPHAAGANPNNENQKGYYYMCYTSYDEEELLRELKSGKSDMEPGDSDSWKTLSSSEECNGASESLDDAIVTINDEQTSI